MKIIASCLFAFVCAAVAQAEEKAFIRVQTEKGEVTSLQTASVVYKKGDLTVDLVGVIHVGDKAYYRGLQRQLATYDSLLYELVAPKGVVPERKASMFGMIVKAIADLDMQLACINYRKANFVHADLSFQEILDKNGGGLVVGLKLLADMLQKNKSSDELEGIAREMSVADTPLALKKAFAKMLVAQMGGEVKGGLLDGLLIKDRNKKVMESLDEQMKGGKKKIGIFYGAAHMPDFEARLEKLGFKREKVIWHTAWDLSDGDE